MTLLRNRNRLQVVVQILYQNQSTRTVALVTQIEVYVVQSVVQHVGQSVGQHGCIEVNPSHQFQLARKTDHDPEIRPGFRMTSRTWRGFSS